MNGKLLGRELVDYFHSIDVLLCYSLSRSISSFLTPFLTLLSRSQILWFNSARQSLNHLLSSATPKLRIRRICSI